MVSVLCDAAVEKHQAMTDGGSSLHVAFQQRHLVVVRFLCVACVEINLAISFRSSPLYVLLRTATGALHYMCFIAVRLFTFSSHRIRSLQ